MRTVAHAICGMCSSEPAQPSSIRRSAISEMSSAWSPIRSMSVIILSAVEIIRRSAATGCCWSSSHRQRRSICFSFSSTRAPCPIACRASAGSFSSSAREASSIARSMSAPISISSLLSAESSWSNRFLIYPNLPVI